MQKGNTSIDLISCGKTFKDGTRALNKLNLNIKGGETVVLLGPSGCGKIKSPMCCGHDMACDL